MQVKTLFVLLFVFWASLLLAQKKELQLEGTIGAGLLEGEKGSAFQLSMMGGIKSKTWTTSVGTGLDYYGIRSIPLYLQVNKKIFNRTQTPFLYVNGGYNFSWIDTDEKDSWREIKTKGGLYYGGGIGYQLPAMKKAALFFAAGYSYKQYSEEISQTFCGIIGPCFENKEKLTRRLRRLSLTTGLRF